MRVTKTIKDYVARVVKEIYGEPTEEEKAYSALKETLEAEAERINEKFVCMIKRELDEFNTIHGLDEETGGIKINGGYICSYSPYSLMQTSEIGKKAKEAGKARQKKIVEAIENIILTLELGGNKADLDRMLNELKENK